MFDWWKKFVPPLVQREVAALVLLVGVALPLAPNRFMGPHGAINPQSLVRLGIMLMLILVLSQVAQRVMGPRVGLSIMGFVAGFVSSSATIAAMGAKAQRNETSWQRAAAAALASNVGTILLYPLLIVTVDPDLAWALSAPLVWAFAAAVGFAGALAWIGARQDHVREEGVAPSFGLLHALAFVGLVCVVSVLSAALYERFGTAGIVAASAVASLADAHSTAGSLANLHASGMVDLRTALIAVVSALSTNSVTKIVMAWSTGHRQFGASVTAGVLSIVAGAWLGVFLS